MQKNCLTITEILYAHLYIVNKMNTIFETKQLSSKKKNENRALQCQCFRTGPGKTRRQTARTL